MPLPSSLTGLSNYLAEPATWIAVLIPGLCSTLMWWGAKDRGDLLLQAQAMILGTAISILCSAWREVEGVVSLHMLPGYPLVLLLAPKVYRPCAPRAYGFCFISLLAADVTCAMQRALTQLGEVPDLFYRGVGGAGFGDALFIVPIATAGFVYLYSMAERSFAAREPLSQLVRRSATRRSSSRRQP